MDIVNDFVPKDIIVKLKLPNQRAYEVAWSIALLRGYENLDELVNDVILVSIEMFPDGRDDFENISGVSKQENRGKKNGQRYRNNVITFFIINKAFYTNYKYFMSLYMLHTCYIHVIHMLHISCQYRR